MVNSLRQSKRFKIRHEMLKLFNLRDRRVLDCQKQTNIEFKEGLNEKMLLSVCPRSPRLVDKARRTLISVYGQFYGIWAVNENTTGIGN